MAFFIRVLVFIVVPSLIGYFFWKAYVEYKRTKPEKGSLAEHEIRLIAEKLNRDPGEDLLELLGLQEHDLLYLSPEERLILIKERANRILKPDEKDLV